MQPGPEITFIVERDEDAGIFVASWDAPEGGGITTQGSDLGTLQQNVREAVRCHFDSEDQPVRIRFHFLADPVLSAA